MTAAFNLSQLANNLNTSGQLDATDGLTGAVPVANGGTGSTTAAGARSNLGTNDAANITTGTIATARLGSGTANSTTYLRGDQTWATVSGGVTSLNGQTGAITNTNLNAIGSYIIGRPAINIWYSRNDTVAGSSLYATSVIGAYNSGEGGWPLGAGQALINTGTWRCMAPAPLNQSNGYYYSGLWVRIS